MVGTIVSINEKIVDTWLTLLLVKKQQNVGKQQKQPHTEVETTEGKDKPKDEQDEEISNDQEELKEENELHTVVTRTSTEEKERQASAMENNKYILGRKSLLASLDEKVVGVLETLDAQIDSSIAKPDTKISKLYRTGEKSLTYISQNYIPSFLLTTANKKNTKVESDENVVDRKDETERISLGFFSQQQQYPGLLPGLGSIIEGIEEEGDDISVLTLDNPVGGSSFPNNQYATSAAKGEEGDISTLYSHDSVSAIYGSNDSLSSMATTCSIEGINDPCTVSEGKGKDKIQSNKKKKNKLKIPSSMKKFFRKNKKLEI